MKTKTKEYIITKDDIIKVTNAEDIFKQGYYKSLDDLLEICKEHVYYNKRDILVLNNLINILKEKYIKKCKECSRIRR